MFVQDPYANLRRLIQAPAHLMKTYQIDQPLDTHFRPATCQEVDCPAYAHGWRMGFDLTDPERAAAARWVRDHSGRAFTADVTDDKVMFTFPAGQSCFRTHRVPLQREPFYIARNGDFRGNPRRERRTYRTADPFVDDWATDLDKLNTQREKG